MKMDAAQNISQGKYLFDEDTLGVLLTGYLQMQFNARLNLFDLFLLQYDTTTYATDIALARFDRQGQLKYYKKWDYTVVTQKQPFASDFQDLGDGRYLLPMQVTNDIYVIADTAEPEIDTSYFKPDIRELHAIEEMDDSYILFGIADGAGIFSPIVSKLQYAFWELDKQTLQEKSRQVYKMKDTVDYEIDALLYRDPFTVLDNGDYIFTSAEVYYYKGRNLFFSVLSIYRMDSLANKIWSYRVADTSSGESFATPSLSEIPGNSNKILWHNAYYSNSPTGQPGSSWVMKFDVDGSDFGIGLPEEKTAPPFSLYPNPASGRCMVLLPFLPDGPSTAKLYNLTGQLVHTQTFKTRDNLLKLELNALPPGNYLLEVESGEYQASQKLVVE